MERKPQFPIGTQFKTRGKFPKLCAVTDIHITHNSNGDLVKLRYVAEHEFMGQLIVDHEVCETTIAMGQVKESGK